MVALHSSFLTELGRCDDARPDVDVGVLARELARAHAELLTAGVPVSVSSLLVGVGRCPLCTRPVCGVCVYCSQDETCE